MLRNALGVAAILAAICAASAQAATVTAPAAEDTSVEQQNPNTNFGSGNDEDQCYKSANTTVSGGTLKLVGRRQTVTGCGTNPDGGSSYFFTSGMVTTRAEGRGVTMKFRQGYAEVRMRVPAADGTVASNETSDRSLVR